MEKEILSRENEAMERWRNGDPMRWAEISTEDVIYVDPGQTKPIVGLADYSAFLKNIAGTIYYQGSEFIHPKVMIHGDAAVLSYNYRSTVNAAESMREIQTLWNATEVYFYQNKEWKIAHTHWSYVNHKLPAAMEIPYPVELVPGNIPVCRAN
jgi:ketosteroid isomerase-like protein